MAEPEGLEYLWGAERKYEIDAGGMQSVIVLEVYDDFGVLPVVVRDEEVERER